METRKRRSRVLLKAIRGTSAGSNHRCLQLSEESEMSDDCSLASKEGENAKSVAGVGVKHDSTSHSTKTVGPGVMKTQRKGDTGCSQTQSVPFIHRTKQGKSKTVIPYCLSVPSNSKGVKLITPEVPLDYIQSDTPQLKSSSKMNSDPQSPSRPLFHPPVTQPKSSSESTGSSQSTNIVPYTPNNTPSDHGQLRRLSSQSHPNIHSSVHAMPHPPSPASLGAQFLFARSAPTSPNVAPFDSRYSSRCSSNTSYMEGVAVCDIANTPKVTETKRGVSTGQAENRKLPAHRHTARKSLSQPVLIQPSEYSRKVRKKKHKFISPSLSVVNYSSTDSLPSLRFSVVKPSDKEPHNPKPRPKNRRQVHPAEWQDEPTRMPPEEPVIQSPSSTSGSSVASRNPSSTHSSVSLVLGPLLTSSLRIRRTKSATDNKWGDIGVAQLESCFPDRHIRLYVVTWNMQEKKDLPASLDDLLLPLHHNMAADMFVIGTQESTPSRKEWEVLIQKTLGPYYVMVQSSSIGVIYLSLFIRRDLIWFCSATSTANFATRPVTIIKTKGAVGLSFTLFGSSFLFITSHFTAGKNKVLERNADMQRIAANLSLHEDVRLTIAGVSGDVTTEFDYVFWFGDLNYRVDIDRQTANKCLATADIMSLLLKDQLTREMLQMNTFPGFSEQPIAFPPSYKFDLNSNRYDTSEKQRIPSWTDRILYKSRTGSGVSGCGYTSCSALKCSDHRPVCGVFRVKLEPSHHVEGVAENVASFDREVYLRANKQRSTVLALARATEEVDGTSSSASSSRRDFSGRRPVTSQFCTIM